jgi:alkyl hydroperoxide reductase subunit AhpC
LATFRLRLGSTAPNFKAETTLGLIDFHEWIGDKWAILFSHPEDYTPVCTTELAALAKYEPEFTKRGVKLIGLSANTVETHGGWINDIDGKYDRTPQFISQDYRKLTAKTAERPHSVGENGDLKGLKIVR